MKCRYCHDPIDAGLRHWSNADGERMHPSCHSRKLAWLYRWEDYVAADAVLDEWHIVNKGAPNAPHVGIDS